MHWSKSRHTAYEECARRFFFSEIAAQKNAQLAELSKKVSPALVRHEAVRLAVSDYSRTSTLSGKSLPKVLQKAKLRLAGQIPNEYDVNAQFTIVESCLTYFVAELLPEIRAGKVLYAADGEPVEFIYDGLNISTLVELALDKDDRIEILNWKTGDSGWRKSDDLDLRAGTLTCWARKALNEVTKPIIITDVYLKEGPPPVTRYSVELDDEEVKKFIVKAKAIWQRYNASGKIANFPAHPSFTTCRWCTFTPVCFEYQTFAEPDYGLETLEESLAAAEEEKDEARRAVGGEWRSVMLNHVSSDKDEIVRPFARALEAEGISHWLDEGELKWGQTLSKGINRGLATSDYLVSFISEDFLGREWPQAEFGTALAAQMSDGMLRVLPILIGDKEKIFKVYPMLRNIMYKVWTGPECIPALISDLKDILATERQPV